MTSARSGLRIHELGATLGRAAGNELCSCWCRRLQRLNRRYLRLEIDGFHDPPELTAIRGVGGRHVHRIDDESLAADIQDPQAVDLPRALLKPAAVPRTLRGDPALEHPFI